MRIPALITLGAVATLLPACGDNKVDVVAEQSDMAVETVNASDVPVNLPTTAMTNVPEGEAAGR